jgi:hypothetical protein
VRGKKKIATTSTECIEEHPGQLVPAAVQMVWSARSKRAAKACPAAHESPDKRRSAPDLPSGCLFVWSTTLLLFPAQNDLEAAPLAISCVYHRATVRLSGNRVVGPLRRSSRFLKLFLPERER